MTAPADSRLSDERLAEALRTAYRRAGGIPALARSEGGADKIIEVAVREFVALLRERRAQAVTTSEPIGYARPVDVARSERPFEGKTSFWCSEHRNGYYNVPLYLDPPPAQAAGVTEWQPIETAPKDTAVLTYGFSYEIAHFNTGLMRWVVNWDHRPIEPTHWMPLPEPAALSDREE